MKELSIEEKAQRYDEAIKRAKSIDVHEYGDIIEAIFPELRESEDERIRLKLIEAVKGDMVVGGTKDKQLAVAWLEKQGEHANFHNKIQIGDKVTRNEDGVLVNLSQLKRVAKPTDKVEPKFKVGDTVTVKPMSCHGKVFKGEPFKIVDIIEDNYVSDDGKAYSISLQDGWELVEQKPAWSEEDEEMLEDIRFNFEYNKEKMTDGLVEQYDKFFDKVKSLKPQPKQEWSEKDKCMLNNVIDTLKPLSQTTHSGYAINSMIDWLKSLRPQNWTKEDKERYISCLQRLSTGNPEQSETINSKWFKEHVYPQSHWKPSDEQMHYLSWIANVKLGDSVVEQEVSKHLNELYEDLKKLREK